MYLGGYETEVEAARAYDRCVVAHSGLDAPLNVSPLCQPPHALLRVLCSTCQRAATCVAGDGQRT